jgi:hypothetical protein
MEKTLPIMKQEAYLLGWQDAAGAITKTFEQALRTTIESIAVPNFGDENDNKEESQSTGSDV